MGSSATARDCSPQPLSRRGDRLLIRQPPAVVEDGRRRQDPGQQQHDRSGGRQAEPAAGGSSGGLQVVRGRTHRRLAGLRRRGELGATFLRRDGTVWTTDKDGLVPNLLAAEITARTGKDPGEHYQELTAEFGTPYYTRIDAPATPEQKARLAKLSPEAVRVGAGRRADHGQTDQRPGQQRPHRRPQGGEPPTAGSRPGRPAPRTSTRSTRKALRTRPIWTPSCLRPRGSSITLWRLLSLTGPSEDRP